MWLTPQAVFFDRDGTLNVEVNYLSKPEQLHLLPFVSRVIKCLNKNDIKSIIITNQAGIARGYFTEADLAKTNETLKQMLWQEGAFIDALYYCPHHPDGIHMDYSIKCDCRKPLPGMIYQACTDFNIDPQKCWLIGDKLSDIEAGMRARCITFLVLTGYGKSEVKKILNNETTIIPDFIIPDFKSLLRYLE